MNVERVSLGACTRDMRSRRPTRQNRRSRSFPGSLGGNSVSSVLLPQQSVDSFPVHLRYAGSTLEVPEHSREDLEFPDTSATPEAFYRLVIFGVQMQDQLPVAGELEVARFASVVARWRSVRARRCPCSVSDRAGLADHCLVETLVWLQY